MPGPFYFAWTNPDTGFNPAIHTAVDEHILTFKLSQAEGDFATLEIEIPNPEVGLLSFGRKVWAWFSYNGTPLFYGRLVGIPTSILAETVTLTFIAKPSDFTAQKTALAASMKVRPYFDPVFIDTSYQSDPDTVLEGYSALWHTDKTSHVVTVSDIIAGEDGTIVFSSDEILYDSVSVNLGQAPLSVVSVTAAVEWTQTASGTIDLSPGTFRSQYSKLLDDWPAAGTVLKSGWTVASASAVDYYGTSDLTTRSVSADWDNNAKEHNNGDTLSMNISFTALGKSFSGEDKTQKELTTDDARTLAAIITGQNNVPGAVLTKGLTERSGGYADPYSDPPVNIPLKVKMEYTYSFIWFVPTTLSVSYSASRKRTETVSFDVYADLQPVVTEAAEDSIASVSLTGADVGVAINGTVPIGDVSSAYYFPSDRGCWSIEYLLCVARTRLLSRARVVEIGFDLRFTSALGVTLRKNGYIADPRLPGGEAFGKIIEYTLKGNGDTGEIIASVKLASAIGYGGAIVGSDGNPTHNNGYVSPGYQAYTGAVTLMPGGALGYSPPIGVCVDDGLVFPLDKRKAVISETKSGGTYRVELRPVTSGPFNAEYNLTVTDLIVPQQIDLEATA